MILVLKEVPDFNRELLRGILVTLFVRVINTRWHNRQTPKFQRLNPTKVTPCLCEVWCGPGSPPPPCSCAGEHQASSLAVAGGREGWRRHTVSSGVLIMLSLSSVSSLLFYVKSKCASRLSFHPFSFRNFLWILCCTPPPVLDGSTQFLILTGLWALQGQKPHHVRSPHLYSKHKNATTLLTS